MPTDEQTYHMGMGKMYIRTEGYDGTPTWVSALLDNFTFTVRHGMMEHYSMRSGERVRDMRVPVGMDIEVSGHATGEMGQSLDITPDELRELAESAGIDITIHGEPEEQKEIPEYELVPPHDRTVRFKRGDPDGDY